MSQPEGPDLRFVQANERTLLAWLRTSLGLLALGFVMARSRLLMHAMLPGEGAAGPPGTSLLEWAGTAIAALAPLAIGIGMLRYHRAHRALVEGRPPAISALGPGVFAAALAIATAAAVLYLIISAA